MKKFLHYNTIFITDVAIPRFIKTKSDLNLNIVDIQGDFEINTFLKNDLK